MIIYLAGTANSVERMSEERRKLYNHVLFSFFLYTKKNYAVLKALKRKERKRAGK